MKKSVVYEIHRHSMRFESFNDARVLESLFYGLLLKLLKLEKFSLQKHIQLC